MVSVSEVLTELVIKAADSAGYAGVIADPEPVMPASNPKFGDYQSNHAFRIGRAMKGNPRAVAEAVCGALASHDGVNKVEVAGPGFINFHLNDAWLIKKLAEQTVDAHQGIPQRGSGRTVVIDYSSPNVAKRMHIGHMRSTIIGNTIDRLHKAMGWKVIADNHIGDWGTQFGKLIVAWREHLDEQRLSADAIGELERLYVLFGDMVKPGADGLSEQQEALHALARAETAKLQAGDAENRALWEKFLAISRDEMDGIYARLGVHFDVTLGESFYRDALADVVESMLETKTAKESDGAVIVQFGDDTGVKGLNDTVLVIQKNDGAFLYGTTDLATLEYRLKTWSPDRVVYVTDGRQQLHFKQVFSAWNAWRRGRNLSTDQPELVHMWFGTLKIGGEVLSTRKGNVIRLMELLDEANLLARRVVEEGSENVGLSDQEKNDIATAVGVGAIRYFDLSQKPQSDVNFTWDRALSLQGNTAPFLMYSYARCRNIQRKSGLDVPQVDVVEADHPREKQLVRQLLKFPLEVEGALEALRPNLLCDYLFETAGALNRFYADCRVLQADTQSQRLSRLALVEATARVLEKGLDILGIVALERM